MAKKVENVNYGVKVCFSLKGEEFSENHNFGSQGASKSSKYDKDFICFRARGAKSAKNTKNLHFHENSRKYVKIHNFH